MKISDIKFYDGAEDKVCRLGISHLFLELLGILLNTKVLLLEEKQANGAATLRKMIDAQFAEHKNWIKQTTGGIDWRKKLKYNQTIQVNLGVEVQVSARSDLLIRDIIHLRNSLQQGEIDVGVIVVPSNHLQYFLPDRTPSLKDAVKYIEQEFSEAMTYPIVVISIEHDGPGDALAKQKRRA